MERDEEAKERNRRERKSVKHTLKTSHKYSQTLLVIPRLGGL